MKANKRMLYYFHVYFFHPIAGFENPAYELKEIEKENVETVDITVNASSEKICQKETYIVSDNVGDVHL